MSPTDWDPALTCKHDYMEKEASHFQVHSDSQLGPTLAPITLQMWHSEEQQKELERGGGGWGAIKKPKKNSRNDTDLVVIMV